MSREAVAGAVAAVLLLGACASAGPSDEGGFGLPTLAPGQVSGAREELTGVLHVERDGCFTWSAQDGTGGERRWVLWPPGAEQDGDRVLLPDGTAVGDGDVLTGTGLVAGPEALPDWDVPDSYLRSFGGFCDAEDRGVVVLDGARSAGVSR